MKTFYTEQDMLLWGKYLLSDERWETLGENAEEIHIEEFDEFVNKILNDDEFFIGSN